MGIIDWHKSGSQSARLGRSCKQSEQESRRWTKFWRKIKGEKKGKKSSSTNSRVSRQEASYDRDTYLQNFDEETRWAEPDHIYRSFSARFTDPSRAFSRTAVVD